jgi:arginyl-tRNA synthetase
VEPKKRITFNPEESIEFTGNTGPSIQYSYVRTRSIVRKATEKSIDFTSVDFDSVHLHDKEIELLKLLKAFPKVVSEAAGKYSPAHVANYNYELAKEFNQYYDQVGILIEEDENLRAFRINLSLFVGNVLKNGMALLGIEMPERM